MKFSPKLTPTLLLDENACDTKRFQLLQTHRQSSEDRKYGEDARQYGVGEPDVAFLCSCDAHVEGSQRGNQQVCA